MKTDNLGHCTRFSDSSFYDEKCIFCGGTDGHGDDSLGRPCTNTPKPGDSWRSVSYPVMPEYLVEWRYDPPPPNSHF